MRRTVITICLGLGACGRDEPSSVAGPDGANAATPDIQVEPTLIDFGEAHVGVPVADQVVTLVNQGDADLHLEGIYVADGAEVFSADAIGTVVITPGGTAYLSVSFTPTQGGQSTGAVAILSDDPDEGTIEVPLTGVGLAPTIDVQPMEHDFGTTYIGCDMLQPLTITNVGNADLVVAELDLSTESGELALDLDESTNGALPWTLAPSEDAQVWVGYAPEDESSDTSQLIISSNDPYSPQVTASQQGAAERYDTRTDVFEQPHKAMADVIFAVDRSSSMADSVSSMERDFDTFVSTMGRLGTDVHVMATVEDDGCLNGPYIDDSFGATEARVAMASLIDYGGSTATHTHRAFTLLSSFLAQTGSGGCNAGALRDEATLHLVGVSDAPEQSPQDYREYVSLFQSYKDDPRTVVVDAIGGDIPSGCGDAAPYTGMYEATVATGGLFLSICATDWSDLLEALARSTEVDLSTFELSEPPVPDSLVVRVDGVQTTVGWEYDDALNAVEFDGDDVPDGGAIVEIDYTVRGGCEE